jgi:cell division protein FtsI (penicillin-binding protein 3)
VRLGHPVDRNVYNRVIALPLFRDGRYRSGMIVEQEHIRQYPYGKLARRTIGFVRNNKSEVTNTHIGLEGKFDYVLHGQEGREWMRVTDYGRVRNSDSAYVKAVDGKDLRITLNIDYQDIADRALREQIANEQDLEGACFVLMEVSTGAIRAMVNLVREDGNGPFEEIQNLAIGRKAEPGSVFKTVTLMSVLNDGFIKSLEETMPATNGNVAGTTIKDAHIPEFARQHHTNRISILDGFKISSNYVFATLAVKNYGIDKSKGRGKGLDKTERFLQNIYNYKLGEAFAFDLDGLQTPTIPNPSTRYWTDTDLGSIGFGYSTEETPLHILTFYNAIANKGRMMKPYLVEDIEENGIVTERRGPGVLNAAVCSKAVADTITRALKAVTEDGTARRLKDAKCAVAGKTGTSFGTYANGQYQDAQGRRKYQGTFVGFFPADKPQYSVICMVYSKPTSKQFQGGGIPAAAIRTVVDQLYNIDPCFRDELRRSTANR